MDAWEQRSWDKGSDIAARTSGVYMTSNVQGPYSGRSIGKIVQAEEGYSWKAVDGWQVENFALSTDEEYPIWATTPKGGIWKRNAAESAWEALNGCGADISISSYNEAYVIGKEDGALYTWSDYDEDWLVVSDAGTGLVRVDASMKKYLAAITEHGKVITNLPVQMIAIDDPADYKDPTNGNDITFKEIPVDPSTIKPPNKKVTVIDIQFAPDRTKDEDVGLWAVTSDNKVWYYKDGSW